MEEPFCLAGRLISPKPVLGPGRHQSQVIGHLGQVHGTVFHDAGHRSVAVQVLGSVDHIVGLHQLLAGQRGHIFYNPVEILYIRIQAGSDGGTAQVQAADLFFCILKAFDIPADG